MMDCPARQLCDFLTSTILLTTDFCGTIPRATIKTTNLMQWDGTICIVKVFLLSERKISPNCTGIFLDFVHRFGSYVKGLPKTKRYNSVAVTVSVRFRFGFGVYVKQPLDYDISCDVHYRLWRHNVIVNKICDELALDSWWAWMLLNMHHIFQYCLSVTRAFFNNDRKFPCQICLQKQVPIRLMLCFEISHLSSTTSVEEVICLLRHQFIRHLVSSWVCKLVIKQNFAAKLYINAGE